MAKELPYFRFYPDEYLNGDITFESNEAQGLFILACCYYWKSDCKLTLQKLNKRITNAEQVFNKLIESKIIKHNTENDEIKIDFLFDQFCPLISISEKRKKAGILSGKARSKTKQKLNKCSASDEQMPIYKDKDKDKNKDKTFNISEIFFSEQPEGLPQHIEKQFAADCDWVIKNCPRVFRLERPLTAKQFYAACKEFSPELVKDKLSAMDNKKTLLKDYTDANKTLRNWCKSKTF